MSHFANSEEFIFDWGAKGEEIKFSNEGRTFLSKYGIEWGAAGSVLCQHRDKLGKSLLTLKNDDEDRIVYSVLPALIGPATWRSGSIGLVDGKKIRKATGGNVLNSGTLIAGIENWIGASNSASVLFTTSGFLMRLDVDDSIIAKLVQQPHESVDWSQLFPGVIIAPENMPAPTKPAVPDQVTEPVRNESGSCHCQAKTAPQLSLLSVKLVPIPNVPSELRQIPQISDALFRMEELAEVAGNTGPEISILRKIDRDKTTREERLKAADEDISIASELLEDAKRKLAETEAELTRYENARGSILRESEDLLGKLAEVQAARRTAADQHNETTEVISEMLAPFAKLTSRQMSAVS